MRTIGSPPRRAFAHNDNAQPRPLYDGLEHGFTAIEADVFLTYAALHDVLSGYDELLTQDRHDGTLSGPVRVVVSGHVELPLMEQQLVRYATADARIQHLEQTLSPVVSMVSAKWSKHFAWSGEGPMEAQERAELERIVGLIHDAGCTAHFWGCRPAHVARAARGRRRPDHHRRPPRSATIPARP